MHALNAMQNNGPCNVTSLANRVISNLFTRLNVAVYSKNPLVEKINSAVVFFKRRNV